MEPSVVEQMKGYALPAIFLGGSLFCKLLSEGSWLKLTAQSMS